MPKAHRYDHARGTAAQRGYDARWRRLRKRHLSQEPLCRECRISGHTTAATLVDHVIPHRGDPHLFNAPWNLQSLDHTCHNRKTAGEEEGWVQALWPILDHRPTGPVQLVCGPPSAGKSTFVREAAGERDVVLDLDDLRGGHHPDLLSLLAARNRKLSAFVASKSDARLWFIVTAGRRAEREFWAWNLGGEVIVLETPEVECRRRERSRGRTDTGRARAITKWWARYRVEELGEHPEPQPKSQVGLDGVPLEMSHHWHAGAL